MKTLFLLFTALLLGFQSYGQNKDETHYSGATISMIMVNPATHKTVRDVVMGKDVRITYDRVFKTYLVTWRDDKGQLQRMFFHFLTQETHDVLGTSVPGNVIVYDDQNSRYYVHDKIDENGTLVFFDKEKIQGLVTWIEIDLVKLNLPE